MQLPVPICFQNNALFTYNLYKGLPKNCELVKEEEQEVVVSHGEKVKGIREVLARDHMKVAFFGRYNSKSQLLHVFSFCEHTPNIVFLRCAGQAMEKAQS